MLAENLPTPVCRSFSRVGAVFDPSPDSRTTIFLGSNEAMSRRPMLTRCTALFVGRCRGCPKGRPGRAKMACRPHAIGFLHVYSALDRENSTVPALTESKKIGTANDPAHPSFMGARQLVSQYTSSHILVPHDWPRTLRDSISNATIVKPRT